MCLNWLGKMMCVQYSQRFDLFLLYALYTHVIVFCFAWKFEIVDVQ